ncbi:hypothetical protein [Arthrobacter sp. CJ23]|uniref:hypothetical protein n=1 Tax=Arthrobacter sp. CJ23 TaxID=2972479 RepID=UPI00215C4D9E|nr:hypothetical protein [Arthrobacter sp. CJ23]UVJ40228.1 hypothetical protein NVV90_03300 [Arthrobacter sp. CJ23]
MSQPAHNPAENPGSAGPAKPSPAAPWIRAVVAGLGAAVAVAIVVLAFLWPTASSSIKDFPLAVAGPSQQVEQFSEQLKERSGVFTVTAVADRAAAVELLETRQAAAAVVLGNPAAGQAPEVISASASSPVSAQLTGQLTAVLNQQMQAQVLQGIPALQGKPLPQVTTSEVAPLAASDTRGTGITAAAFPMVLGGILGGIVTTLLVRGPWRKLTAIAVYSVTAGALLVWILEGWFGFLQNNALVNAAAIALALAATASLVAGCAELLGPPGIALGAVVTMFIANPISSAAAPKEFLPGPWGAIGQDFVPGASSTLLRSLSYFPRADTAPQWLVLGLWTAGGAALLLLGLLKVRGPAPEPVAAAAAPAPAHAPAPAPKHASH